MMNVHNYGVASGRLTADPTIFTNSDNSRKVRLTVAAQDNYKSKKTGAREAQFLPFEAFIPKEKSGEETVYDRIKKGDKVTIVYTVKNNNYEKNGVAVYDLSLAIESLTMEEPKSVTEARHAQAAANVAEAAAEATTEAPAEAAPVA